METENKQEPKPVEPTELEKIELDNVRIEAALKKRDELLARKVMGGQAEAGQAAPAPRVENPKEYANRILKGQLTPAEKAKRYV